MRVNFTTSGQGRPIIFLHGIGSSSATWNNVIAELGDGYQSIAIDLMGHGESPVPDDPAEYSRDAALGDIDDAITTLSARPILVGWSLGGYLALAHAATRIGASDGVVVLNTGPGFRNPEKREAWNERSRRNAHRFGVVPQAAELNLQHDSVVMEKLGELEVPILVLAGSEDRPEYAGAGQYMQSKMINCEFKMIDGGGHAMHEDSHAAEVAQLVDEFAKRIASAT